MNTDLTEKYAPLKKRAEQLTADLNSGGFDADLEWIWSDDAGCPLPAVTVAGTGVLTLGFDGSVYRFVLPRRKALTCRFPVLAAKYRLRIGFTKREATAVMSRLPLLGAVRRS